MTLDTIGRVRRSSDGRTPALSPISMPESDYHRAFAPSTRLDIVKEYELTSQDMSKPVESDEVAASVARPGGISYIHIPALDARASAAFYAQVFGWKTHGSNPDRVGFEDGSGHVGGAFVTNQEPSAKPGVLPYIYVSDVRSVVEQISAQGGEMVQNVYAEGSLLVATFRDVAGNVMGVWEG